MIVDPKIKGYDFTALNARAHDTTLVGTTPLNNNIQIDNIYSYYKNLSAIKAALTDEDYGYLYAPLKEPYFEVNTNSRVITVPDVFRTNGIGVTGDHYAETICFSVNRYFDTRDLSTVDHVYIYWTRDDGTEGKDKAYFIDPIAKADYLIIGWPLNEDKFKTNILKFYISFEDDNDYRLNTLTAQVKVNSTLEISATTGETNYEDFNNFNSTNSFVDYELSNPSGVSLVHDLQVYTGEFKDVIAGPHKENLNGNSLTIGAQFEYTTGVTLNVKCMNETGEVGAADTVVGVDGGYSRDITTPGAYYFVATPQYVVNGVTKNGPTVKTSTIIVMKAMPPILEDLVYAKTLPTDVYEITNTKVVWLNESQSDDDVLITATISGLDYSTDISGLAHTAKDYGVFKLVHGGWIEDEVLKENVEIEAFENKVLKLTKAQLVNIKEKKAAVAQGGTYSLKVVHSLNGSNAEIAFPLDLNGLVVNIAESFVNASIANKITLNKSNGSFTLTRTIVDPVQSQQWQYYNGKTWITENNVTGDTWYIGSNLGGYSYDKAFAPTDESRLIAAVSEKYRLNLIKRDTNGLTETRSVTPGNDLLTAENFYKIEIGNDVLPNSTEGD